MKTRKSKQYDIMCPKCKSEDTYPKRSRFVGFIPEPPAYAVECEVCGAEYIPADNIIGTHVMTIRG